MPNDNNLQPHLVHTHDVQLDADYTEWLVELKARYRSAQIKAAVRVNAEKLLFNWQLGRDLVIKKAESRWGEGIVEQLSLDLKAEFPGDKGFGARNLYFMKQWFLYYTEGESHELLKQPVSQMQKQLSSAIPKLHQLGAEMSIEQKLARPVREIGTEKLKQPVSELPYPFALIPWGHHIAIMQHSETLEEALFYMRYTIDNALSRPILQRIMKKDDLYHNQPAVNNFSQVLTPNQTALAQEIVRENYDFSFATVKHPTYDERELEDALYANVTDLLLELGNGFAFLGRQREIRYGDNSRKIDLLFYHIRLRCYVVVELKARAFEPEYAGKLNFYVNMVNDTLRQPDENPTIGLLICSDMDKAEVQWSFQGIQSPIGVATYNGIKVSDVLPSEELLRNRVRQLENELRLSRKLIHKLTEDTNE